MADLRFSYYRRRGRKAVSTAISHRVRGRMADIRFSSYRGEREKGGSHGNLPQGERE